MGEPLTLYGMSSPNVRKVVIALEEIGLPYRTEHVAVFRGRQFEERFLALNPMAKVPVILDPSGPAGAVPIFESGAILIYLAESYAPQFYPAEGPGRWEALKWLMLQMSQIGPVFGQHGHYRLMEGNDYAAGRFRRATAQLFQALERRLGEVASRGGAPWLGGDAYSIADMATYPWAKRLKRYGMDAAEYPHLSDWRIRIEARPAIERAHRAIEAWAEQDTADRAQATEEETKRFLGLHIRAPSAQAAGAYRGQTKARRESEQ
ncbi:glutathione S-transferase N-terminal domain-containing protein [Novosphingobium sp. G106]|uniref:glutathione S-transferase family protein n=1 Tax=Novosphingobium sp. G106 TaxID=2849500 RepID=UPI001C2DBDCD|nr:glutathione S-transferase N-terminal domain-containing protein [Novosphingobium sp. G106]MBV1690101.1 glutathione S-transferase N-terminal domain-containing protein [Novosphingobium sp. G106]